MRHGSRWLGERRRADRRRALRARRALSPRGPDRALRRGRGPARRAARDGRVRAMGGLLSAVLGEVHGSGGETGMKPSVTGKLASRRMQSRVEREGLLKIQAIETCGVTRIENQVPAVSGHRARNRHEAMETKKIVAEGLLARAHSPRTQPIGVWHVVAFDDVNLGNIGKPPVDALGGSPFQNVRHRRRRRSVRLRRKADSAKLAPSTRSYVARADRPSRGLRASFSAG